MKNNKGFTLVELMVVVAILGLLSAIAVISVTRYRENATEKEKISLRQNVISTFGIYRIDNGIGIDTEVNINEFDAIFNFNGERCTDIVGTIKAIEEGIVKDEYCNIVKDKNGNPTISKREVYCVEMTCNGIKVINDYETNCYCN